MGVVRAMDAEENDMACEKSDQMCQPTGSGQAFRSMELQDRGY